MSDVVVRAQGLGKRYLIGHEIERERYIALRDVVGRAARNLLRSAGDMMRGRQLVTGDEVEEFWALKDIDFEIKRGEVVGIIGRNGAGKSTLLKILSRITEPSVGRVEIRGRVASLLEVGTGFHPELTGRENIYLNGAILGMTRAEIRRKFDEIVSFAEVEKFLDTPVKRYSSGMYVRLAFAVAAHLEPEILIVDEVLAVGDAEFQKKCLGKMQDVASHGRTVLFVSHNMAAVRQLCAKGIVLKAGSVAYDGLSSNAISQYLRTTTPNAVYRKSFSEPKQPHVCEASLLHVSTDADSGRSQLVMKLVLSSPRAQNVNCDVRIRDLLGSPVAFATLGALHSAAPLALQSGKTELIAVLDVSPLAVGQYVMSIDLTMPWIEYFDRAEDCLAFEVGPDNWTGVSHPFTQEWRYGSTYLPMNVSSIRLVG